MFSFRKKKPKIAANEQRNLIRRPTQIRARIIVNKDCVYNCTVRDLSYGGAMLEMAKAVYIPINFTLENLENKKKMKCQRAWQKDAMLGVRFIRDRNR